MGIDIYMSWKGQTEEDKQKQYTGFDTTAGKVGYLREAYHGEPYATKVLVPEAFSEDTECKAKIPAAVMLSRLPFVLATVEERERNLYKSDLLEIAAAQRSYVDFVRLAAIKEKETGEPVEIYASY